MRNDIAEQARVAKQSLRLIRKGWVQGKYGSGPNPFESTAFCAVGAIRMAASGGVRWTLPVSEQVINKLAELLVESGQSVAGEDNPEVIVVDFNDDVQTTKEDVINAFEHLVAKLENES